MPPKIFGGQHPRYQHHEIFKTKVMNGWRVKYRCRSLLTVQILLIGDTPAIAMSEFGLSDRQPGCTRIRCVGIVQMAIQMAMTCSTLPPLTPEVVMAGSSNRDEIAALRKRAEAEQLSQTRETRQRDAKGMNRKRHQTTSADFGRMRSVAVCTQVRKEISSLLTTNGQLHQHLGQLNGFLAIFEINVFIGK